MKRLNYHVHSGEFQGIRTVPANLTTKNHDQQQSHGYCYGRHISNTFELEYHGHLIDIAAQSHASLTTVYAKESLHRNPCQIYTSGTDLCLSSQ